LQADAALAPASGVAISISTPIGAIVAIRGLYLNGSLGGVYGVYVSSAGTILSLENMVIAGFSAVGSPGVWIIRSNFYGRYRHGIPVICLYRPAYTKLHGHGRRRPRNRLDRVQRCRGNARLFALCAGEIHHK
jgi:hypothetical protein